eukprot:TRINITY_DN5334_c0_g1_i1.p1 TRINITY_DN5334_c0_g1~~TRINITY_DN5334_c0_g1_i1.p1  ORF type:complete len:288 (+),score=62.64 TRINITY_DN5334_c0_g1_i1:108-971(+)
MSTSTTNNTIRNVFIIGPNNAILQALPPALRLKLIAEGIGSFFFFLTIAVNITPPVHPLAPLAIGMMLTCMIYSFGYVSGAHFNPAVTMAVMVSRNISVFEGCLYMLVQVAMGFASAFFAVLIHQNFTESLGAPDTLAHSATGAMQTFLAESTFTFALAITVLHVAASPNKHNQFYGHAIGGIIIVGAVTMGEFSGGSFNPAVSLAFPLTRCTIAGHCRMAAWSVLYIVAEMSAGAMAGLVFRFSSPSQAPSTQAADSASGRHQPLTDVEMAVAEPASEAGGAGAKE